MIDAIQYAHLADLERCLAIYGDVAFELITSEDLEYLFEDFKDRGDLKNEVWKLRTEILDFEEEEIELRSYIDDLEYDLRKAQDRIEKLEENL